MHKVSAVSSNILPSIFSTTCHKLQQLLPYGNTKGLLYIFVLAGGALFESFSYDSAGVRSWCQLSLNTTAL